MSLHRTLYRSLCKCLREFHRNNIPLTGIVGSGSSFNGKYKEICHSHDVHSWMRFAFREPPENGVSDRIDLAFNALRSLQSQLATLKGAEQSTRDAFAAWNALLELGMGGGTQSPNSTGSKPALPSTPTAEEACMMLHSLYHGATDSILDELEDTSTEKQATIAKQTLDDLARQVLKQNPQLFKGQRNKSGTHATSDHSQHADAQQLHSNGDSSTDINMRHRQLQAISRALFQGPQRFKNEPFEWVYDGLHPLLLSSVLKTRKGMPLTLAVLYNSIAHRLGVPTMLLKGLAQGSNQAAEGPANLQGVPAEIAARQAGRTLAAAPPPDLWLVAAPVGQRQPTEGPAASSTFPSNAASHAADSFSAVLFVDTSKNLGAIMDLEQVKAEFPEAARQGLQSRSTGEELLEVCLDLVRTAMVAHQRRGESDLVAHWLYQVLALDADAPEWAFMLQPPPLQ